MWRWLQCLYSLVSRALTIISDRYSTMTTHLGPSLLVPLPLSNFPIATTNSSLFFPHLMMFPKNTEHLFSDKSNHSLLLLNQLILWVKTMNVFLSTTRMNSVKIVKLIETKWPQQEYGVQKWSILTKTRRSVKGHAAAVLVDWWWRF